MWSSEGVWCDGVDDIVEQFVVGDERFLQRGIDGGDLIAEGICDYRNIFAEGIFDDGCNRGN